MTAGAPQVGAIGLQFVASCQLPTPWATFTLHGFLDPVSGLEHVALTLGDFSDGTPVLARVHSECLTGDALFSQRCDCGAQLEAALSRIATEQRGLLFYLRQEGRGIGLLNKIRAYRLQELGADTVEANEQLGFAADLRSYALCLPMLQHLGIERLRLMTNNPLKILALQQIGIEIVERVEISVGATSANQRYLETKATRMGHLLSSGALAVDAPAHGIVLRPVDDGESGTD